MGVTLVNEDVVSFNFVVTSLMDENEKKKDFVEERRDACILFLQEI